MPHYPGQRSGPTVPKLQLPHQRGLGPEHINKPTHCHQPEQAKHTTAQHHHSTSREEPPAAKLQQTNKLSHPPKTQEMAADPQRQHMRSRCEENSPSRTAGHCNSQPATTCSDRQHATATGSQPEGQHGNAAAGTSTQHLCPPKAATANHEEPLRNNHSHHQGWEPRPGRHIHHNHHPAALHPPRHNKQYGRQRRRGPPGLTVWEAYLFATTGQLPDDLDAREEDEDEDRSRKRQSKRPADAGERHRRGHRANTKEGELRRHGYTWGWSNDSTRRSSHPPRAGRQSHQHRQQPQPAAAEGRSARHRPAPQARTGTTPTATTNWAELLSRHLLPWPTPADTTDTTATGSKEEADKDASTEAATSTRTTASPDAANTGNQQQSWYHLSTWTHGSHDWTTSKQATAARQQHYDRTADPHSHPATTAGREATHSNQDTATTATMQQQSKRDSQAAADHEERLRTNPYLQEDAEPPTEHAQQRPATTQAEGRSTAAQQAATPYAARRPTQDPPTGTAEAGNQQRVADNAGGQPPHFQHLDEAANAEARIRGRGPHSYHTPPPYYGSRQGGGSGLPEWNRSREDLQRPPKKPHHRALLDHGQELWTAPPFPEGTILEVETQRWDTHFSLRCCRGSRNTGKRGECC